VFDNLQTRQLYTTVSRGMCVLEHSNVSRSLARPATICKTTTTKL